MRPPPFPPPPPPTSLPPPSRPHLTRANTPAALYLAWAWVPDAYLASLGVTCTPAKHFALALPVWLSALVVALFWVYEGGNMALAVPFDAPAALHDARSRWAGDVAGRARPGGVPPLVDVPASEANRLLYDDG